MSTVSVIIPAYNQGNYLGACVKSVLDQTYRDFEIIIVDDGSTDNTCEVATQFSNPRVRYIYQDNRGLSGARNTGIRNATGTYITYLDSDDLFLPQKLEILIEKLESEPDLGFVAGQAVLIDENGQKIGDIFDAPPPSDPVDLLLGNPLHVGSVLLRREWQERAGFFDETLRSYEDWDLWLRLALAGCKMGWVDRPVSLYRFHRAQMTRHGNQMTAATFAVLDKIYSAPDLPGNWRALKNRAYSSAHLRAAPQAYREGFFEQAKTHMDAAVRLDPGLKANQAEALAKRISGWADYAKIDQPLNYLENVYAHLPESLAELQKRRRAELGQKALQVAFRSYAQGNLPATRSAIWQGIRYNPGILADRGLLSIFARSLIAQE